MIKNLLTFLAPKKQPPVKPLPPVSYDEDTPTMRYIRKPLLTLNYTEDTRTGKDLRIKVIDFLKGRGDSFQARRDRDPGHRTLR